MYWFLQQLKESQAISERFQTMMPQVTVINSDLGLAAEAMRIEVVWQSHYL